MEPPGIAMERQEKAVGKETDDLRIRFQRLEGQMRKLDQRGKAEVRSIEASAGEACASWRHGDEGDNGKNGMEFGGSRWNIKSPTPNRGGRCREDGRS